MTYEPSTENSNEEVVYEEIYEPSTSYGTENSDKEIVEIIEEVDHSLSRLATLTQLISHLFLYHFFSSAKGLSLDMKHGK